MNTKQTKEIKKFLKLKCEESNISVPLNIGIKKLEKAFIAYLETDFNDWLNSNFNSFFNPENFSWNDIKKF